MTSHPVGFFTFKSSGIDPCANAEDYLDFLTLFMEKGSGGDPLERMPASSRRHLRESWPHVFRTLVPAMVGDAVEARHDFSLGRRNTSLPMMISLSILKEVWNMTDEALENAVRFDLRFHYALGLEVDETDWNVRALYRFREQVLSSPQLMWVFDTVVTRMTAQLDAALLRPGLDAKRMRFNMMMQLRLGGLVGTLEAFLKALEGADPVRFGSLPRLFLERYGKRPGAFANVRPDQCRRQWDRAMHDANTLITRFDPEESIHALMSFQVLGRTRGEQQAGLQVGCLLPDSLFGSEASEITLMPGRA
ncbi:MAG: transposase [Magnetococcales bacterium]|nr:transposase [Magnetococcales bacterium]